MNQSHWDGTYRGHPRQDRSTPFGEIAARIKEQIFDIDGRLLLLTVNPTLSGIGRDIIAVDRSEAVVRYRWPGNTPSRQAVVGDWLDLPFANASFSSCVGDGSTNMLKFQDLKLFYGNLSRVLRPVAKFICRVYLTPDKPEPMPAAVAAPWQGGIGSFLYFKFRLGMAIAAESHNPSVPVASIYDVFTANFPDRRHLAAATGWERSEIDKIDLYKASPEIYNFPTRQQMLSVIPPEFSNPRFIPVGGYEFAERCPLLCVEKQCS